MKRFRGPALVAMLAVLALSVPMAASASTPAQDDAPAVDQPGVTDDTIRVGGVMSITNPIGGQYGGLMDGVRAYARYLEDEGGVHGRNFEVVADRDDETGKNQEQVIGLLEQDDVFAAFVATLLFTGADTLVEEGVPTFGWNINAEWSEGTNLFGEKGSHLCFTCPDKLTPWLARAIGAKRVASVAFNVPQSADCSRGHEASFETFDTAKLVFVDRSVPYGNLDFSGIVAQMVDEDVQFVMPCMDNTSALAMKREMLKQGLDVPMWLPNAYNHEFIDEFGDLLQGSYVLIQWWPFEATPRPPGLKRYLQYMKKIDEEPTEVGMAGWIGAALLHAGLEEAGPNFTRQSVIDAINQMTDWTADGISPGVDWTIQHDEEPVNQCAALLEITDDGKLSPTFGRKGKPFICFDRDGEKLPKKPTIRG